MPVDRETLYDHNRGMWLFFDRENIEEEHVFDSALSYEICTQLQAEGCLDAIDLGCGTGRYVEAIRSVGIGCRGYDGNPFTPSISGGLGEMLDLSLPVHVGKADWVISLEVGEHIPAKWETTFINNLCGHAKHGIILSWCIPEKDWPEGYLTDGKEGGLGHVNCRTNQHICWEMHWRGFHFQHAFTDTLRQAATQTYFKKTLMVFKNKFTYENKV